MLTFRATVKILNHFEKCGFTRFISLWYYQAIKFIKSNQLIYIIVVSSSNQIYKIKSTYLYHCGIIKQSNL